MSAAEHLKNHRYVASLTLPSETLDLLNTYLDDLIRQEALSHSAEVMLRRISPPVCALADSVEDLFRGKNNAAMRIINCAVKIAKLSGSGRVSSDALQKTVIESIGMLRSKHVNRDKILQQINADLESVLHLALIKVPSETREDAANAGRISGAKIVGALMVVGHARRFDLEEELLYLSLTQWFELLVVAIIQCGAHSRIVKEADRLTFMLFYIASDECGEKRERFLNLFISKFNALLAILEPFCLGHIADFSHLKQAVRPFIAELERAGAAI